MTDSERDDIFSAMDGTVEPIDESIPIVNDGVCRYSEAMPMYAKIPNKWYYFIRRGICNLYKTEYYRVPRKLNRMLNDTYKYEYGLHWFGPEPEKAKKIEEYIYKNIKKIKKKYIRTTRFFNDLA